MKKSKETKKPQERRRSRQDDTKADWSSADPGLLRDVITAVTRTGGALRFGYSQDGGAYSMGVYGDGEPFTEYLPGGSSVDGWLEGFKLDYE